MAEKTTKFNAKPAARSSARRAAPKRLKLLCVIVNREKAEFFMDVLLGFEINLQLAMAAHGTADEQTLRLLGLAETPKAVLLGVVREDRARDVLSCLEEKFRTVKGGKGIACTIPMTSTIGVAVYQFLCNDRRYLDNAKGDRT